MHRIRQSLPYYPKFGWEPTVVCVQPEYVEAVKDNLLLQSIPNNLRIISLRAFSPKITRKVGLGSLALRSIWFYYRAVNQLLHEEKYDLIFFSTTQFPVLILGNYWKRRFGVPYVIDMQDPWYSTHYLDKPKAERPPKFWFSYYLNKYLEPISMRQVSAIIAVSEAYHQTLQARYPWIKPEQCHTLTFGAFEKDMEIAQGCSAFPLSVDVGQKKVVYIGRGGKDMWRALRIIFRAVQLGLEAKHSSIDTLRFFFLGTSYAQQGRGQVTIAPLAKEFGLSNRVTEITDRLPYFQSLQTLQEADFLLVPGSDDPQYTASKIYPYILTKRPIIAVFQEKSSVVDLLRNTGAGQVFTFSENTDDENTARALLKYWLLLLSSDSPKLEVNWAAFEPHFAQAKTVQQVSIFEQVLLLK
ncbi:MAG: glycosyltransferase [Haliscomenobacter sp.]|uniref:glycosyltransferase n=1 Tax=Haliscomenobacter sp. TaxID=2717303 RepID=UPI0029A419C9|nr:glycosyltransferase [Haliscomenobacter sp.]MDX2067870.1 glycosyltransferase [Haliscomenobacter sp.]